VISVHRDELGLNVNEFFVQWTANAVANLYVLPLALPLFIGTHGDQRTVFLEAFDGQQTPHRFAVFLVGRGVPESDEKFVRVALAGGQYDCVAELGIYLLLLQIAEENALFRTEPQAQSVAVERNGSHVGGQGYDF